MSNHKTCLLHSFLLTIVLAQAICVRGDLVETPRSSPPRANSGPYCGVNCVFAVATIYGRSASYEDLIQPRFVGSHQGSNLSELIAAVESVGLYSTPQAGMTIDEFRSLAHPSILLLSRHRDAVVYHHWVLVLKAGPHHIRILASPGKVESLTYAQLLSQWDGVGLVVYPDSNQRLAGERDLLVAQWSIALLVAIGTFGVYSARSWLPPRWTTPDFKLRRVILGASFLVGLGALMGLLWHCTAPTELARNREAIAIVKSRFFSRTLPRVTRQELVNLVQQKRAVLIDARDEASFDLGHIPSAINVPVYTSPTALQEFARTLPAGQPIIVYCQSETCEYDDQIGSQLSLMGVQNLALYHEGWKEWKEWKRGPQADAKP